MKFIAQKFDIAEYKKFYQSIGSIPCPYFKDESISFNRKGFTHLIRSGRSQRTIIDQQERLSLLRYCKAILAGDFVEVEYRAIEEHGRVAQFWGFISDIDSIDMKLVVRQIESGRKHFFGIFPIKHQTPGEGRLGGLAIE